MTAESFFRIQDTATLIVRQEDSRALEEFIKDLKRTETNLGYVFNHLLENSETKFCRYALIVIRMRMRDSWPTLRVPDGTPWSRPRGYPDLHRMEKMLLENGASLKDDYGRVDYTVLARLGHRIESYLIVGERALHIYSLDRQFGIDARRVLAFIIDNVVSSDGYKTFYQDIADAQDDELKALLDACDGGHDQLTFFLSTIVQSQERGGRHRPVMSLYCIMFRLIDEGAGVTAGALESAEFRNLLASYHTDLRDLLNRGFVVPKKLAHYFQQENNPLVAEAEKYARLHVREAWVFAMDRAVRCRLRIGSKRSKVDSGAASSAGASAVEERAVRGARLRIADRRATLGSKRSKSDSGAASAD